MFTTTRKNSNLRGTLFPGKMFQHQKQGISRSRSTFGLDALGGYCVCQICNIKPAGTSSSSPKRPQKPKCSPDPAARGNPRPGESSTGRAASSELCVSASEGAGHGAVLLTFLSWGTTASYIWIQGAVSRVAGRRGIR